MGMFREVEDERFTFQIGSEAAAGTRLLIGIVTLKSVISVSAFQSDHEILAGHALRRVT
jgi:hypothetical protein